MMELQIQKSQIQLPKKRQKNNLSKFQFDVMKTFSKYFFLLISLYSFAQDDCAKGETAFKEENYKLAQNYLKNCFDKNPNNSEVNFKLARSYAKTENWKAAAETYKTLVEANPNNADYNFYYGGSLGLYAKSINPVKSVTYISDIKYYLKKAIELNSKHIDARWALVQIYMELPFIVGGSKSTAENYAAQLLKLSPVDGRLALGYIYFYEEDWKAAEQEYKRAVAIGKSETCYQKLIEVQLKQNKLQEAKKTLQEAYQVTQVDAFKIQLEKLNL